MSAPSSCRCSSNVRAPGGRGCSGFCCRPAVGAAATCTICTDLERFEIEAVAQWDAELRRKMSVCDTPVMLVSRSFLESHYVRTVELPVLVERARAGRTRLLWILLSSCGWRGSDLHHLQAAFDPRLPLDAMNPADLQVALVGLRQPIEALVSAGPPPALPKSL